MNIFAVIVLYKTLPADSPSLTSLLASAATLDRGDGLAILVWDNTPGGQQPGDLPACVQYHSAPDNPGLSAAYNCALEMAFLEGYDWLLTLDQDSVLPIDFVNTMAAAAGDARLSDDVGAIVPRVVASGRNISPFCYFLNAFPSRNPSKFNDGSDLATYAINSAAMLRVSSLKAIGGYNPLFPLDISDVEMFHRLHRWGARVRVVGTLCIEHDFSILDKTRQMSVERYKAQLIDECAFWDMEMQGVARMERIIRLMGRVVKDGLAGQSPAFLKATLWELKRRLLTRRKHRIRAWKTMANQRAWRFAANSPAEGMMNLNPESSTQPHKL